MRKENSKFISIRTQFEALHNWPDAPRAVAFLRHPHRHLFKVQLWWEVDHNDRDREFFVNRSMVDYYIRNTLLHTYNFDESSIIPDLGSKSCEDVAESLLNHFSAFSVLVSEDGENEATVFGEESKEENKEESGNNHLIAEMKSLLERHT